jgi:hypothetical protein
VFDSQIEYQTMRVSIRVMSLAFQAMLSGVRISLSAPILQCSEWRALVNAASNTSCWVSIPKHCILNFFGLGPLAKCRSALSGD